MANYLLKGRYSMRTFGYTIDDTLSIRGAKITEKTTGVAYPGPVKVLEPITALACSAGRLEGSEALLVSQVSSLPSKTSRPAERGKNQHCPGEAEPPRMLDGVSGGASLDFVEWSPIAHK